MQAKEKIALMDKVLRELNDIINSQTAVLKKDSAGGSRKHQSE